MKRVVRTPKKVRMKLLEDTPIPLLLGKNGDQQQQHFFVASPSPRALRGLCDTRARRSTRHRYALRRRSVALVRPKSRRPRPPRPHHTNSCFPKRDARRARQGECLLFWGERSPTLDESREGNTAKSFRASQPSSSQSPSRGARRSSVMFT